MSGEPVNGLFGILDPVLHAADGVMAFLPPLGRLLVWGLIAGVLSILLYRAVSPQARLRKLSEETTAARAELKSMQPHDAGYAGLIMRSLMVSLRRLGVSFFPALVSALPVLLMVVFLDTRYGLTKPEPGELVAVLTENGEDIAMDRGQQLRAGWVFAWPGRDEVVQVRDAAGSEILAITSDTRPGLASKGGLLRFLFGAPAGGLPGHSTVDSLVIETTPRDFVQRNVIFPFQWTIPYFLAVILASLGLKFALRIK